MLEFDRDWLIVVLLPVLYCSETTGEMLIMIWLSYDEPDCDCEIPVDLCVVLDGWVFLVEC